MFCAVSFRLGMKKIMFCAVSFRLGMEKKICSVPFPFVLVWLGFAWFLALSVCLSRGFRFVCLLCLMEYVVSSFRCCSMMALRYWAVQAGLLTPLTFARHRLSPLAAFTSGAYFLHTGRR